MVLKKKTFHISARNQQFFQRMSFIFFPSKSSALNANSRAQIQPQPFIFSKSIWVANWIGESWNLHMYMVEIHGFPAKFKLISYDKNSLTAQENIRPSPQQWGLIFIMAKYATFSSRAENWCLLESPLGLRNWQYAGETSNENSAEYFLVILYVQTFICGAKKENISHFCDNQQFFQQFCGKSACHISARSQQFFQLVSFLFFLF